MLTSIPPDDEGSVSLPPDKAAYATNLVRRS